MRKYWCIMAFDLKRTVVVFDLDDTLYPEADYVASGLSYVCEQIQTLYGKNVYGDVKIALMQDAKVDWLGLACEIAKLPGTAKESFIWMYRLHLPDIALSDPCQQALKAIRAACGGVAVLTDGRSVTQRLKLKSLGLLDWPAYISEDYGSTKPSPERFLAIQADFSAEHYVYVADNVQKDFIGCRPLGWIGIGMLGNERNVHSQRLQGIPKTALPAHWVSSWQELTELLGCTPQSEDCAKGESQHFRGLGADDVPMPPEPVLGMGAVVTKHVPPGVTVVGNPARPLVKSS